MATIDDKVVAMSFESSKFESGVDKTINAINKLKGALKFPDAGKGFDDINAAAGKVDLSRIGAASDTVKAKISTLALTAATVLANIATKALAAGAQIVKSLTLDPIMEGFHNYETQINAVQTILANTGLTGQKGLNQVNSALADLNTYANQTVYNFSEMARNIGTFTAAGVGLKQSEESIKGIANLAALSGSNSQQASSAMYQLSQAIAAGSVKLQDWNSVVNAGMGGEVFQKALFNTGKAMGTLTNVPVGQTFDEWKKAGNSFRQSISATGKEAGSATDAIKKAQTDAARTISDASQAAADAVSGAAKSVRDAQAGVSAATRQGAADVASAMKDQSATVKKSGEDVKAALDGVVEARKRLAEAMKPPSTDELQAASDKLQTAQLDQQDLSDAVTQAQQDQTRSAQDLTAAQQKLVDVQSSGGTPDQIMAAQRAVEDAQQRVTDSADAQTRALLAQRAAARDVDAAQQDLQTTQQQGTKKDKNVQDAQDALTAALKQYKDVQVKAQQDIADAATKVAVAKQKSAQDQIKAGQALADAEKNQAKTIKDSEQRVADAHTNAAAAINAARASVNPKPPTSWLTSDVLTNTLQQFTGDMTDAQLAAKGFSGDQIKAIQAMAKTALGSATNIKTISQLMQALKEEVATSWAAIFKTIFGNLGQATTLFSKFHIAAENALTKPIYALNTLLESWSKLGGRTVLINTVTKALKDLGAIADTVKSAFRDIFPPTTGKDLYNLTVSFSKFIDLLTPSAATLDKLRRSFAGIFAVMDMGRQLIGGLFAVFKQVMGAFGGFGGGFLDLTANLGDFLVKVDESLKKGDKLVNLFNLMGSIMALPIRLAKALGQAIGLLFSGFDGKASAGMSDALGGMSKAMSPMQKLLVGISAAWDKFLGSLGKAEAIIKPMMDALVNMFQSLGPAISNAIQGMDFGAILQIIQTGLIGGIYLLFKGAFGKGTLVDQVLGRLTGAATGPLVGLSGVFKQLTGTLTAMQQNIKANTLLQIAAAVALLAGSIVALSFVDEKKLNTAMATITIVFGELLGAMKIMEKIGSSGGFIKMPFIAASMILMAVAIDILSLAVIGLSKLSWGELTKGLTAVSLLLVGISGASKILASNGPGLIIAGAGLLVVAVAMNILALAVKQFGSMDLATLGKGLGAVALALVGIGLAMKLFPATTPLIGAGLVLVGVALQLLVRAVAKLGAMDWKTLEKGMVGIAGSLLAIAVAMNLMPPTMVIMAAGLVLVSVALQGIVKAVTAMGGMSVGAIAKGIIALAASLLVLSVALYAMSGSIAGAVALGIAAAGLALLSPALVALGKQSWGQILKGIVGLALAMTVLGIAGALMEPVVPTLIGLGLAMALIGAGLALAGAGIALVGIGLSAIAVAGPVAIGVLLKALTDFLDALPGLATKIVQAVLAMATALANSAPQFITAFSKILDAMLDSVVMVLPHLVKAMEKLVEAIIKVLEDETPNIIQAAINLLEALIKGITDNLDKVVEMVVTLITTLLDALAKHLPDLFTAGANALASFIKGIADNMTKVISKAVDIVTSIAKAIADNIAKIVTAAASIVTTIVTSIANAGTKFVKAGADAIDAFVSGIGDNVSKVTKSAVNTAGKFMDAIASGLVGMVDRGAQALVNLLNGIADAIKKYEPQIIQAGFNIGTAMVTGMINGLDKLAPKLLSKLGHLIKSLPKKALGLLGISSPSKVFMDIGENIVLGLASGIDDNSDTATSSIENMTNALVDTMSTVPDALDGIIDMEPVIAPVLDLTAVQAGADQMNNMINTAPVVAATSSGQAAVISSTQTGTATSEDVSATAPAQVQYVQNNYSPDALSEVEIYRQTKNQIAQLKTALA